MSSNYVAPRNEIELQIAGIWQEFLGLKQVGVHDDFFELGGHSLLATQIVSRLRDTLHSGLTLRDFFNHLTIAGLSETIEKIEEFPTLMKLPQAYSVSRVSRLK